MSRPFTAPPLDLEPWVMHLIRDPHPAIGPTAEHFILGKPGVAVDAAHLKNLCYGYDWYFAPEAPATCLGHYLQSFLPSDQQRQLLTARANFSSPHAVFPANRAEADSITYQLTFYMGDLQIVPTAAPDRKKFATHILQPGYLGNQLGDQPAHADLLLAILGGFPVEERLAMLATAAPDMRRTTLMDRLLAHSPRAHEIVGDLSPQQHAHFMNMQGGASTTFKKRFADHLHAARPVRNIVPAETPQLRLVV